MGNSPGHYLLFQDEQFLTALGVTTILAVIVVYNTLRSECADLSRGVDLERLHRPADHPRPQPGTTITTGIYRSIGRYQADLGSLFALMFLATLPVLIFYLALQKQFVKGRTGGATKG
ncbi:hypothetical protein [Amycolatopsis sp. cmx-11-51]|uniref:hypothetical protein n=1 Tax=Amycolatopsis sp. cmx-11-51 TaxID=2785797 RepID=UPI0039E50E84